MHRLGIILIFLFLGTGLQATRKVTVKTRIKEAYSAVRTASGQEKIEGILLDSISRPGVSDALRAKGYYVCALLEQSINEDLNQKAYLKQKLDTFRMFKSVYMMYRYMQKCDSVDHSRRYVKRGSKLLAPHRVNLLSGGKFLMKKDKWADAYSYFDMYLATMRNEPDSVLGLVSCWAVVCAMNENKPYDVLKYVQSSIDYGSSEDRAVLMEYKCRSYAAVGDSINWMTSLREGLRAYPKYDYFFLNLIDWDIRHDRLDEATAMTDSLMLLDSEIPNFWFAKSMIALSRHKYDECIQMSDECLKRDHNYADAWYNKGVSLLNQSLAEKDSRKVVSLLRLAEEPMEMVRRLQPQAVERWGRPLYRIYLKLNRGDKFEEIDRILSAN